MGAAADDPLLAPLRSDLEFYRGPNDVDGAPTYSLFDPLTGVYHKVGWAEATVLEHMRRPVRLGTLMERLRKATTLDVSEQAVRKLCRQISRSGLTVSSGVRDVGELLGEHKRRDVHPLKWLAFHYIFFRVPVLRPDAFLRKTVGYVRHLASRPALALYAAISLVGLFFLAQHPGRYLNTFVSFFEPMHLLTYGLAIVGIKAIHEFAHCYTAAAYGVRVRAIGVAFMVFAPIPFSDVTDAWRLADRRARAAIGIAGVCAEVVIAGICLFFWGLTEPPGMLNSLFFVLSSASLLSTLAVNLNPAMRFDGYYILTDLWGIDNLQNRAFAMTRWALHRWLLGLEEPLPEQGVSARRLVGMMVYSLYAWMYRIGLYIGIAILVYYKFWKALGIILFTLEIAVFLVRPMIREVAHLWAVRGYFRPNPRLVLTILVLLTLLVWVALPLPRRVDFPAVAEEVETQVLYAPGAGRLENVTIERDARVQPGQVLFSVVNEQRRFDIRRLRLEHQRLLQAADIVAENERGRALVLQKREEAKRAAALLQELLQREAKSVVVAHLPGIVYEWDRTIRPGRVVESNKILGRIVRVGSTGTPARRLVAYVHEDDRGDIEVGLRGSFMPADDPRHLPIRVVRIEDAKLSALPHRALGSVSGGPIPVVETAEGRLNMMESWYRIEAEFLPAAGGVRPPRLGQSGKLWIQTEKRSLLLRGIRTVTRILIRESGF
jgi:putative peptide zinc metalloprotease protein